MKRQSDRLFKRLGSARFRAAERLFLENRRWVGDSVEKGDADQYDQCRSKHSNVTNDWVQNYQCLGSWYLRNCVYRQPPHESGLRIERSRVFNSTIAPSPVASCRSLWQAAIETSENEDRHCGHRLGVPTIRCHCGILRRASPPSGEKSGQAAPE